MVFMLPSMRSTYCNHCSRGWGQMLTSDNKNAPNVNIQWAPPLSVFLSLTRQINTYVVFLFDHIGELGKTYCTFNKGQKMKSMTWQEMKILTEFIIWYVIHWDSKSDHISYSVWSDHISYSLW